MDSLESLKAIASAQHEMVAWCLPGATNLVLLQANSAFNIFIQIILSMITVGAGLAMCIYVYNTMLAFKYKEATRHDWLSLLGAFAAVFVILHTWDLMAAITNIFSPSPMALLVLLLACLLFNAIFVGYYLVQSLRGLVHHTTRQLTKVHAYIKTKRGK